MEKYQLIERSIITTYRKKIWAKFVKAVKDYKLINENDRIMVCISGGKDSFLLAKCIEEIKKHGDVNFSCVYVVMNPGYSKANKKKILENAKILNLDIEMFDTEIFKVAYLLKEENPCYMCARMRRGYLYDKAKQLGCNKIALGHHFNDVIETTLMSMLYSSEIKTMMPKLHSTNYPGLELIRPLYLVKEEDIIAWANYNELNFINCACKFSELASIDVSKSKRLEIKNLIKELKKVNSEVDHNIFKSMENVNLECILGTVKDGKHQSFLDNYEEKYLDK